MTSQFEFAADAIAELARDEAKAVADRASVRMAMLTAANAKLMASGLFKDGVPFGALSATVDNIFAAAAGEMQKSLGSRLKGVTIDPNLITMPEAQGVLYAERAADTVIAHLQRKAAASARQADAMQIMPVSTAELLAGISDREAAVERRDYPAKASKKAKR